MLIFVEGDASDGENGSERVKFVNRGEVLLVDPHT